MSSQNSNVKKETEEKKISKKDSGTKEDSKHKKRYSKEKEKERVRRHYSNSLSEISSTSSRSRLSISRKGNHFFGNF